MPVLVAFAGHHVIDNFARLFVIGSAIFLAMVAAKIGVGAVRRREVERIFGILAFMCFCLTPAITGIARFGAPVNWYSTGVYFLGLLAGAIATWFHVSVSPPWIRFAERRRRNRRLADIREDAARSAARGREDKATLADRTREDINVTEKRDERDEREQRGDEPRVGR